MANGTPALRDYHDVIAKVAAVKDLDVVKLKEIMEIQEAWERRQAETLYSERMALAQQEMSTISKDSTNPATRSRYASLPALDNAIRPIYTKHGFAIEFDEELDQPDRAHIVIHVSNGAATHRRHLFVPFGTVGARGQQMMTATHAKLAAVTYARRALLKMVFNLAEEDDDGVVAGSQTRAYTPANGDDEVAQTVPIKDILARMEACATLGELIAYKNSVGKMSLFPPDRDAATALWIRLRDEFQAGTRTPKKPDAEAPGT